MQRLAILHSLELAGAQERTAWFSEAPKLEYAAEPSLADIGGNPTQGGNEANPVLRADNAVKVALMTAGANIELPESFSSEGSERQQIGAAIVAIPLSADPAPAHEIIEHGG